MNRRHVIAGGGASLAAAFLPGSAGAEIQQLGPPGPMGVPMRAWVGQPQIVRQNCQFWCWAASTSMIFAAFGHPVRQERIVEATFGAPVCTTAPSISMAQALSRSWQDENGRIFQSQVVAAYDAMFGVNAITNDFIINELANNRPVLYANTHHAMVCVSMDFYQTPYGPNPQAVGVLDPWPWSPAYHLLEPLEMRPAQLGGQMTFLASVAIY